MDHRIVQLRRADLLPRPPGTSGTREPHPRPAGSRRVLVAGIPPTDEHLVGHVGSDGDGSEHAGLHAVRDPFPSTRSIHGPPDTPDGRGDDADRQARRRLGRDRQARHPTRHVGRPRRGPTTRDERAFDRLVREHRNESETVAQAPVPLRRGDETEHGIGERAPTNVLVLVERLVRRQPVALGPRQRCGPATGSLAEFLLDGLLRSRRRRRFRPPRGGNGHTEIPCNNNGDDAAHTDHDARPSAACKPHGPAAARTATVDGPGPHLLVPSASSWRPSSCRRQAARPRSPPLRDRW
jgi:hypothetical protein